MMNKSVALNVIKFEFKNMASRGVNNAINVAAASINLLSLTTKHPDSRKCTSNMFFEQPPTQEQTGDVAAPAAEASPEPSLIPGVAQEHINNNFGGLTLPENAHNLRRGG